MLGKLQKRKEEPVVISEITFHPNTMPHTLKDCARRVYFLLVHYKGDNCHDMFFMDVSLVILDVAYRFTIF